MGCAITLRQAAPRQPDCIFYSGVYLVLHIPITGPTTGHNELRKPQPTLNFKLIKTGPIASRPFRRSRKNPSG
jgi:hypothetical protein